jgi:hypothetical protein
MLVSIFIPWLRPVWMGEFLLYIFMMLAAGSLTAYRQQKPYLLPGLALAIPVMHFSWGSGFLWSILTPDRAKHG